MKAFYLSSPNIQITIYIYVYIIFMYINTMKTAAIVFVVHRWLKACRQLWQSMKMRCLRHTAPKIRMESYKNRVWRQDTISFVLSWCEQMRPVNSKLKYIYILYTVYMHVFPRWLRSTWKL